MNRLCGIFSSGSGFSGNRGLGGDMEGLKHGRRKEEVTEDSQCVQVDVS